MPISVHQLMSLGKTIVFGVGVGNQLTNAARWRNSLFYLHTYFPFFSTRFSFLCKGHLIVK